MPRVKIAYDPDLSKVGTLVDLGEEEAARLVREGRAVHPDADPDEPGPKAAPKAAPKKATPKSGS